jgi:hypothetical protein
LARRTDNLIRLQRSPDGVGAAVRSRLTNGRFEQSSVGPNYEFSFIGSDPWETNSYTGVVVPPTPSAAIGDARYLFLLARASFTTAEQNVENGGVRLVGIRQYAELIARIPAGTAPLGDTGAGGPPDGSTVAFRKEIVSPLWHPFDGNISWHVMVLPKGYRDTRNPSNFDGIMYQDALSPALLYQTLGPYTPPNGGIPWGTGLSNLGNLHDLRYSWRDRDNSYSLNIPIPVPCDVALFASVRQNDPALNPFFADTSAVLPPFYALCPEDQFCVAYNAYAQYGSIAGALIFNQDLCEDVP